MKKISHFTTDLVGGAGVAARRLHDGLCASGWGSKLIYGRASSSPADAAYHPVADNYLLRVRGELEEGLLRRVGSDRGGLFTSPRGVRSSALQEFGPLPDLINLHWVSRWLDLPSFLTSVPRGLPVVWSLHDMNPATAGCHLPGECRRFEGECDNCPMIRPSWRKVVSSRFWKVRQRSYEGLNLHIVGNSNWTTNQARKAGLFRGARSFSMIHPGVDLKQFRVLDKQQARDALGMTGSATVVGFACADLSDSNKNLSTLLSVLASLATSKEIALLTMGGGQIPSVVPNVSVVQLGGVSSPEMQSVFYSACDVFVVPSKMETFGLTALEAMACGTPVVAFDTGGLPDFVIPGLTGWLAPNPEDPGGLADCLRHCIEHPMELRRLGVSARQAVEERCSAEKATDAYTDLYHSLIDPA